MAKKKKKRKKKNKQKFEKYITETKNGIKIDINKMRAEGPGKLGRHNTFAKSHVHKSEKDYDRNSKKTKRMLHKIKREYM